MKRLILLRHAKSDLHTDAGSDFDRPLSERGVNDLPMVAEALLSFIVPGMQCLCSPAVRTQQTWALAAPHWPHIEMHTQSSLYLASADELVRLIEKKSSHTDCPADCLMIIAHNPGLSQLLNHLTGPSDRPVIDMPTSCAAVLDIQAKRASDKNRPAQLSAFITPKSLKSGNMHAQARI